ncbi:MAG: calcium/sodium antiporter [Calditrichaeota bacterium]|nr:calcium/sodium antiporter [Calditrichota bacterium]
MLLNVLLLLISVFLLWMGADWLVESASYIAKKLNISELVIGLTVVAFGTSAPEFAVTIGAALKGHAAISVANVVGSDIFNLGFILGGVVLFRPIFLEKKVLWRDGSFLLLLSVLLLVFSLNGRFSRLDGGIFLVLFIAYLLYLYFSKEEIIEEVPMKHLGWKAYPMLIIGLAFILGGAHLLVEGATSIARHFGVSEWLIGVTIVAAGTSTPELATSIVATYKRKPGLSIGNLIGSDIFNISGVLGLAAFLRPMRADQEITFNLYLMLGMIVLLLFFMRTRWKLSRWEGAFLILFGLIRWLINIR